MFTLLKLVLTKKILMFQVLLVEEKKKIPEKKVKISKDGDLCNSHQLRLLHKISNDRDLCNLFSI